MGFFLLDEKTQLALLMAGLVATGAGGCGDRGPVGDSKPPGEKQVYYDDPLPPDMGDSMVADMLPPDAGPDVPIADPLPADSNAFSSFPSPPAPSLPESRSRLPLNRSLRARIEARRVGERLELTARCRATDRSRLSYRWTASAGLLDRTDAATVLWTPPASRGRHMVQVTVRDSDRTISIDVFLHDVE